MKTVNHFIARAALCAAVLALCPMAQSAQSSRASFVPLTSSPGLVLCGPGLVYRCTPQGCYCVRP